MHFRLGLITALTVGCCAHAQAGIIGFTTDVDDFLAAGGVSLTGPLPDFGSLASGNQGDSVTLGAATLTADADLFVGSGWSSLLPGGNAIAISGPENLDISIDTGLSTAFGFFFHEPGSNFGLAADSCNAACSESTFNIAFWSGNTTVASYVFSPATDQLVFLGIHLDQTFDLVTFDENGGIDNEFFGEMYAVRVPEPATLWLLGGSLIGIALMRRRVA